MKATLCFTFFLACHFAFAQLYLTDTEVFDFEIGDVFQYNETRFQGYYNHVFDYTVLQKSFNVDSTEVTYQLAKSSKVTAFSIVDTNWHISFLKDTIFISYPRLNEHIDSMLVSTSIFVDTAWGGFCDTLSETSTTLCGIKTRSLGCLSHTFEGFWKSETYGEGVGLVYHHTVDNSNPQTGQPVVQIRLRGYVKNGDTCGYLVSTSLSKVENHAPSFLLYPNPSNGIFHCEIPSEPSQYFLYNTSGREVAKGQIAENLDFSHLPKGMYILKIASRKGSQFQRIFIVP